MYLGIDFGTSYSKASTVYLDQPCLLMNPGEYGIPSEFYYDRDSGILIGQDALDAGQGSAAANLVSEVKMAIQSGQSFMLDGITFTAKEIVREIYKTIVMKALQAAKKRSIDPEIEGIVISVPAKFGMQECNLISEAAQECLGSPKLKIKAIIKEPVAAALAYYKTSLESNKYVLVYDLGGGTCDIALVRSDPTVSEHYTVVDSDMIRRGGRDWDEALIDYLSDRVEAESGVRIRGNVGYEEKVRRTAIGVKHDLSDPAKERSVARVELNGTVYKVPVTRVIFDEITIHLLQETLDLIQNVYDRNAASCRIEEIICVGGSSNMLQVEEGLKKMFPELRVRLYEPEHAVVNGAAVYADMPQKEVLTDVASFSYGTNTVSKDGTEMISNIIFKGTRLPAVCRKSYAPHKVHQKRMRFDIFESEYRENEFEISRPDVNLVGTLWLELPPDAPKDLSVMCQFTLSTGGVLEVEASEPSGKKINGSFDINAL